VIKKLNKFKLLLPVGTAIFAFSVLLIWIFLIKPPVYSTATGTIIPIHNMGFYPVSDIHRGGNSNAEVYITREEFDGVVIDVLNLKTNLAINENNDLLYALAQTRQYVQLLRKADGIRFKARGDGKLWNVEFFTTQTTPEGENVQYMYVLKTVRDQVIVVDIPYSSLSLSYWLSQYEFDFNKKTIECLSFTANPMQGVGSSLLQIFDFEIY
jgi:hypothetical protein